MPKITIDTDTSELQLDDNGILSQHALGSPEAFAVLSKLWLRAGWDTKYVYSFAWLGRPIIQLPEDLLRIQEVIYRVQPDIIIETGVAHGGSLVFYANLCQGIGHGQVIGVDIEIRPHNRAAIEAHPLFKYITLIEGSSTDTDVLDQIKAHIPAAARVLVMLDSNHSAEHVLAELQAYSPLVSVDSYIVAADGIMQDLADAPRSEPDWTTNNPVTAAREFVAQNPDFVIEEPPFPFNEGQIEQRVTYWPSGFIKRVR